MVLTAIDQELAETTRQGGCQCGGNLYQADYPRSPIGLPDALLQYYQSRY